MTSAPRTIRPISLAIIRRGDDLLVFEGHNGDRTFHRPLGGGIEFGETAEQALHREFQEELGAELTDVHLVSVLENIFTLTERDGHEVVFLFTATLTDPAFYAPGWVGTVQGEGSPVAWESIDRFRTGEAFLVPEGLLSLVDEQGGNESQGDEPEVGELRVEEPRVGELR